MARGDTSHIEFVYLYIYWGSALTTSMVGSIADLVPKGPGFESQISHGFPSCKRGWSLV
jgi:hypothetical protein